MQSISFTKSLIDAGSSLYARRVSQKLVTLFSPGFILYNATQFSLIVLMSDLYDSLFTLNKEYSNVFMLL